MRTSNIHRGFRCLKALVKDKKFVSKLVSPKISFGYSRAFINEKKNVDFKNLTPNDEHQAYLEQAPTFNAMLKLWETHKDELNTINKCTFLNRTINLYPNKKEGLKNYPEIKEVILSLEESLEEMNSFSYANFISNIARIKYNDKNLFDKILNLVEEKKSLLNITSCSYILWAMAKRNINREGILSHITMCIIKKRNEEIEEENVCNIFWALSKLNVRNLEIVEILEKNMKRDSQTYKLSVHSKII